MRKRWYAIIAVLLLAVSAGVVGWLRVNSRYNDNSPLHRIPSSALAVLKINGVDNLLGSIQSTDYRDAFGMLPFAQDLSNAFSDLLYLTYNVTLDPPLGARVVYFSLHVSAADSSSAVLFSTALSSFSDGMGIERAMSDNVHVALGDTVTDGVKIGRVTLSETGSTQYYAIVDECFYISSDAGLVGMVVRGSEPPLMDDPLFSSLERTTSSTVPMSVFVNVADIDASGLRPPGIAPMGRLANWAEFDFDIQQKLFTANGFLTSDNMSLGSFVSGATASKFEIDRYIPASAQLFWSISKGVRGKQNPRFVSMLESYGRLERYDSLADDELEADMASVFSGDMVLFSFSDDISDRKNSVLVVSAYNGTIAQATLNSVIGRMRQIETPREVEVISPMPSVSVPVYEAFPDSCSMLFLDEMNLTVPHKYYMRYENVLFFADTMSVIRQSLYEKMLNRVYANDATFHNFRQSMSDECVFFGYARSSAFQSVLKKNTDMSEEKLKTIGEFSGFGCQVSILSGLPYMSWGGLHEPSRQDMLPTAWESQLDTVMIGQPWSVVNHNTRETEYLVQDANYNIYLINSSGLVLWTRKVEGPILGSVRQIDYYNNRKLQYLFATRESVHLIDRNGNNTAHFPIHLSSPATGEVTYLDYGNPSDFRLFVPCSNKSVVLYDKNCRMVDGWEMKHTEGIMTKGIDHHVTGNKDYLVSADSYRCYITDRRGNERLSIRPLAPNADSRVYLTAANTEAASFVTSTADGKLARINIATSNISLAGIDSIGQRRHFLLRLADDKFVMVDNRYMAVVNANGKILKDRPVRLGSLDWAAVVDGDKIALWDKDESLGYLFDESGNLLEGFPVPAHSPMAICREGRVLHVVTSDGNKLMNYLK